MGRRPFSLCRISILWMQHKFLLALVASLWLTIFGCQSAGTPPPASGKRVVEENELLLMLRSRENSLNSLQGIAELKLSTPSGLYRGKELLSLEPPDRFRVESMNFLGLADLVLCSDGQKMDLYLPSERRVIRWRPPPENLWQISGADVSLAQIIRILMGQPPFSMNEGVASLKQVEESEEYLLALEGEGGMKQRVWIDGVKNTLKRGEILDEQGVWLSFQYADHREVGGIMIPFSLDIQLKRQGVRLQLTYREIRINLPFDSDTFRLMLPSTEGVTILNLQSSGVSGDSRTRDA